MKKNISIIGILSVLILLMIQVESNAQKNNDIDHSLAAKQDKVLLIHDLIKSSKSHGIEKALRDIGLSDESIDLFFLGNKDPQVAQQLWSLFTDSAIEIADIPGPVGYLYEALYSPIFDVGVFFIFRPDGKLNDTLAFTGNSLEFNWIDLSDASSATPRWVLNSKQSAGSGSRLNVATNFRSVFQYTIHLIKVGGISSALLNELQNKRNDYQSTLIYRARLFHEDMKKGLADSAGVQRGLEASFRAVEAMQTQINAEGDSPESYFRKKLVEGIQLTGGAYFYLGDKREAGSSLVTVFFQNPRFPYSLVVAVFNGENGDIVEFSSIELLG